MVPVPFHDPRGDARRASRRGRALLWLISAACLLLAVLSLLWRALPGPLLIGAELLLLGTVAVGVVWPRSGIFARPLLRGGTGRNAVALTFDDGPDPRFTPLVLDLLERHGARATFFVIGERVRQNPQLLAEMVRRGHQVENHSHSHSHLFPLWPVSRLVADLREAQQAIAQAAGRAPRWFRPPVGLISPPVAEAARRVGLDLCAFSHRAYDGLAGTTAAAALRRLTRGLQPGAILVLHDAAERDDRVPVAAEVLEQLLPMLKERGLQAVTLEGLLAEEGPFGVLSG